MSDEFAFNLAIVRGVLSREPDLRVLPSGTVVVAYELTVARDDGPADSVPVVWSDPPERRAALTTGDAVLVVGRVRRRFFRAGGSTQSRTEVVAERVLAGRARATARTAVNRAVASALGAVDASG
jgi:single-strand DNA-binding protein